MKMTDFLEKDKENLLTAIAETGTAAKAVTVLENEVDKLLLKHNEQCETDRERESAAWGHYGKSLRCRGNVVLARRTFESRNIARQDFEFVVKCFIEFD